jgi:hypothetical protein
MKLRIMFAVVCWLTLIDTTLVLWNQDRMFAQVERELKQIKDKLHIEDHK